MVGLTTRPAFKGVPKDMLSAIVQKLADERGLLYPPEPLSKHGQGYAEPNVSPSFRQGSPPAVKRAKTGPVEQGTETGAPSHAINLAERPSTGA